MENWRTSTHICSGYNDSELHTEATMSPVNSIESGTTVPSLSGLLLKDNELMDKM